MTVETLNAERVKHWLTKTSNSISRCKGSGDLEQNYRKSCLCSRYNDLKDRAKELGVWDEYCKQFGWDLNHDGYDCAA